MFLSIVLLVSCLKLLLLPSYRSTDFEVHRNWLAVTSSLPMSRWYFDDTSEWTLDYPPIFAWFEYILSFVARLFDKDMLNIENLNYSSRNTVLFQRLSVIFTDLVFAFGTKECTSALPKGWDSDFTLPVLLLTNIGLLMVDHIHFQYNGIMFGLLLISISKILQKKYLSGAFWFTLLLNMKHIYIYLAPAYFIFLLKNFCFNDDKKIKSFLKSLHVANVLKLGLLVTGVFVVTFLPFYDHIGQVSIFGCTFYHAQVKVFSRMFPFKRGLCHAYWAPNIWALYNVIDKAFTVIGTKLSLGISKSTATMTGGLVQEYSHTVLPNISPLTTLALTGIMMTPGMIKLWRVSKKPLDFIRYLVICALTSFLFGWHVHEKAILMAIIPLSILAVLEPVDAKVFLILSTVGHYSLFPLLFPSNLLLIKVLLLVIYSAYAFYSLCQLYPFQFCKYTLPLLNVAESVYLLGLVPLFLYENIGHSLLGLDEKLPFLPLMMVSVYCSVGVLYSWLRYYVYFLSKCN